MKKKVLVTGACGFIGSHLVDKLIHMDYDVVATDLPEPPDYFLNREDFKKYLNPEAVFIPADLSSMDDTRKLFESEEMKGVETVYHVAAVFNFFEDESYMYQNNVMGTRNICVNFKRLSGKNKRLVLFSSGVVGNDILMSSNYAKSKRKQEEFLRKYLRYYKNAFEGIIVRPAAVFGPRSRYGLAKIVKMIAGGQLQFFVGKKNLMASVVYISDVVDAVIHLAESPFEKLKKITGMDIPVFDLVDDSECSYEELMSFTAGLLKESHGAKIIPIHLPVWLMKIIAWWQELLAKRFKRQPKVTMDALDFFRTPMKMSNSPAKNAGVRFRTNTLKAVEHTINWYIGRRWI